MRNARYNHGLLPLAITDGWACLLLLDTPKTIRLMAEDNLGEWLQASFFALAAACGLPDYQVTRIRTGQFLAGDGRRIREGNIYPAVPRPITPAPNSAPAPGFDVYYSSPGNSSPGNSSPGNQLTYRKRECVPADFAAPFSCACTR